MALITPRHGTDLYQGRNLFSDIIPVGLSGATFILNMAGCLFSLKLFFDKS